MVKGWGPEENYQYWKDALVVDVRQHGAFELVTAGKPGLPRDTAHGFAQCSIVRAQQSEGFVTLHVDEAGVCARGGRCREDGSWYVLDHAPMAADADWPQLIQVAIRLLAPAPFPEDWKVRLIVIPVGPRD